METETRQTGGTVALVVPCFNEESRLLQQDLLRMLESRHELTLVLVDDGSTDGTAGILKAMAREGSPRVAVLGLERNVGKAEAVRRGMLLGIERGARWVGYADADLSTPAGELLRLMDLMAAAPVEVLLGSRVKLLGRTIDRRAWRHYTGRVFATAASIALGLPVYDTQCGAKIFRSSPTLRAALGVPFCTRWVFDVELLARLLTGFGGAPAIRPDDLREEPLLVWRDVSGSKLRFLGMLRAGFQVVLLAVRYRLRR